ncbi:TlpA disulfide reductase family protein [Paenibacillus sp. PL2-23]|uniref:TlpA family protein disulfide reductase n=1 Tax=Paenibacillus sp. PL2-23 TaxID=2100729 RepID=UPI0030F74507
MRKSVITVILLVIAAVALTSVLMKQFRGSEEETTEVIQLKQLGTNETVTVDFSDKPSVMVLFTSWCTYCNADAPKIVQLQDKYKDQLNVYGINLLYRDEESEVRRYADTHGIDYPILLDESGDIHRKYGQTPFPALFFVDKEGNVVDRLIGSTDIETIDNSFQNLTQSP